MKSMITAALFGAIANSVAAQSFSPIRSTSANLYGAAREDNRREEAAVNENARRIYSRPQRAAQPTYVARTENARRIAAQPQQAAQPTYVARTTRTIHPAAQSRQTYAPRQPQQSSSGVQPYQRTQAAQGHDGNGNYVRGRQNHVLGTNNVINTADNAFVAGSGNLIM